MLLACENRLLMTRRLLMTGALGDVVCTMTIWYCLALPTATRSVALSCIRVPSSGMWCSPEVPLAHDTAFRSFLACVLMMIVVKMMIQSAIRYTDDARLRRETTPACDTKGRAGCGVPGIRAWLLIRLLAG